MQLAEVVCISQTRLFCNSVGFQFVKSIHVFQKFFFQVQSTRLADLFEPLNSSQAQSAEELGRFFCPKRNFAWGCGFFVSDVISEVVLGSFLLMLPGLGPNH